MKYLIMLQKNNLRVVGFCGIIEERRWSSYQLRADGRKVFC